MNGTVEYPISRALLTFIEIVEFTCYTQASKHAIWRAAMVDEINAMLKNKAWTLVPYFYLKILLAANEYSE